MVSLRLFRFSFGFGHLGETISKEEFYRLSETAESTGVASVELEKVDNDYAVSSNSAVSNKSFGRVFVDGPVDRVAKVCDVIAVFQSNGRDHWFREVSN